MFRYFYWITRQNTDKKKLCVHLSSIACTVHPCLVRIMTWILFFLSLVYSFCFLLAHPFYLSPSLPRLPWLSVGCRQWFLSFHFRPQIISVGLAGVTPPDPPVRSQTLVAYSVSHAGSACASCGRCGLSSVVERETAVCTPHCHYHILHLATRSTPDGDL